MPPLKTNAHYYGDNLHILRDYIPGDSIDLIYLDPPFNSNRSYNILFKETSSASSQAQIEAFEDTWHWGKIAQETFEEIALHGGDDTARLLKAMVDALGHNDVTAYLTMMAIRLAFIEGRTDRKRVIVSVKGGGISSKDIRDLKGVLEREDEPIGVLVTLRPPTREMRLEAVSAGHYESPFWNRKYPRLQILTVADILNGKKVEMPTRDLIFARPEREREQEGEQAALPVLEE